MYKYKKEKHFNLRKTVEPELHSTLLAFLVNYKATYTKFSSW